MKTESPSHLFFFLMPTNLLSSMTTHRPPRDKLLLLIASYIFARARAFAPSENRLLVGTKRPSPSVLFETTNSNSAYLSNDDYDDDDNIQFESTVKIDDGGSDLTDRFKYKVNALMGVFDPPSNDNEQTNGNILNAMLSFPVSYAFNVVGKTNSNAEERDLFVDAVKRIVQANSGKQEIACVITPRGTRFTKITVEVQVESAAIIRTIYQELGALEQTVMNF
jgi:putative lipoic acid-binding regulatory protein